MTQEGNGQPSAWRVLMSDATKAHLKQLHQDAMAAGNGQAFLLALEDITRQLQESPEQFGEPLYFLHALRLQVRQGVVGKLVVDYGVYADKPLVFIRGFKVLS